MLEGRSYRVVYYEVVGLTSYLFFKRNRSRGTSKGIVLPL